MRGELEIGALVKRDVSGREGGYAMCFPAPSSMADISNATPYNKHYTFMPTFPVLKLLFSHYIFSHVPEAVHQKCL